MARQLIILCLIFTNLGAQTDTLLNDYTNDLIDEELFPPRNTSDNQKPIDINQAAAEELKKIPHLSAKQIQRIQSERPFKKFSDLGATIGSDTLKMIRPYIDLTKVGSPYEGYVVSRIAGVFQKNKGTISHAYPGSPLDIYHRMEFHYNSWLSAGLLAQKDAGESDPVDHIAGYINLRFFNNRIHVILGNFHASAGTGLILSPPYGMESKTLTIRIPSGAISNLQKFLSTHESFGFNGIGLAAEVLNTSAVLFFSSKNLDPLLDPSSGLIYGFSETGLHRTGTERQGRGRLHESSIGGIMSFKICSVPNIETGLSLLRTIYQPQITYNVESRSESMIRRNFYHFSGNQIDNYALFARIASGQFYITGETAISRPGKYAHQITGGLIRGKTRIALAYRELSPEFYAPFGRTPGNLSGFAANHRALRILLSTKLTGHFALNAVWTLEKDLYRSTGLQFPGHYRHLLLQMRIRIHPGTIFIIRYQHNRNLNTPGRQKLRLNLENKISGDLKLRSRLELSTDQNWQGRLGAAMFQDIQWQFLPFMLLITRMTFFHTWNYNLRLYEFENDVPGVLRTVANYGSGNKWYLIVQIDLSEKLSIWMKIRQYIMDDVPSIGSGNDLIYGNSKTDFRFQFRYLF